MPRLVSRGGAGRWVWNTTERLVAAAVVTTAAWTRSAPALAARRSNGISRRTVAASGAGSSRLVALTGSPSTPPR